VSEKNRKSNRPKDYDYSQSNYYFVTICTKNHDHWFGEIKNQKMEINIYGEILNTCWMDLPNHYKNCLLDVSVIMPNHFHGIVIIDNENAVGTGLSEMIRALKTFSSRRINAISNNDCVFR
jgi:putative transposase